MFCFVLFKVWFSFQDCHSWTKAEFSIIDRLSNKDCNYMAIKFFIFLRVLFPYNKTLRAINMFNIKYLYLCPWEFYGEICLFPKTFQVVNLGEKVFNILFLLNIRSQILVPNFFLLCYTHKIYLFFGVQVIGITYIHTVVQLPSLPISSFFLFISFSSSQREVLSPLNTNFPLSLPELHPGYLNSSVCLYEFASFRYFVQVEA